MKFRLMIAMAVAVLIGAASWGPAVSDVEQAGYTTVEAAGSIEIRDYAPLIVAQVEVAGERRDAIRAGFRLLADYIFGDNHAGSEIAMTAPVTQQADENIWKVRFVMPANHTMQTLPEPDNSAVSLMETESGRFAVIRFPGFAGKRSLERRLAELRDFMRERQLAPISEPVYAFFNPPWTLPFLRRNEIMIEIARRQG